MSDTIVNISDRKFSFSTLLEMASHLKTLRKDWKMITLLLIILVVCISSEPYFYKWLIGSIEKREWLPILFQIIGIWLVFSTATIVVRYIYGMRLLQKAMKDWGDFMMKIMYKMQCLPIEYHRNIQAGEKQKIVDRSAEAIWAVADNFILAVLPQILVFITLLISGILIDPIFTLICLGFLPVGIIGVFSLGTTAHRNQRIANKAWDRMFDRLTDGIINLPVIRIFGRIDTEYALMRWRMQVGNDAQYSVRKNWSQFNAFGRFFTIIAKLITISGGGILLYTGQTDYATFFFFIAFTDRIYSPIMELFGVIQSSMRDIAYYEQAKIVFAMDSETDTGKKILSKIEKSITFNNLSFAYPSSPREVLSDIDFEIKKWERIALIGHTGSGKSTIIQLLMRFYEPTQGQILIDGTDIYDFSLESYRSKFAAVFQDTTLFNETIRHNLEYVRDGITDKMLQKACKEANILEFIESLPDKWETQVGERGLKLSGGEKQRIAIARAILANPEILILDEATSALDTKTERLVQDAFDHLMDGRTSIIIAHRLSTIMSADTIYLMEKGRIVAKWSHTELYQISPEYKEMVDLQHDGFVGEEMEEEVI
jgi:ABC-type multidrug transport system fused ATPase/permease subunit